MAEWAERAKRGEAKLTDYVAGALDIFMHQALGLIAQCTCASAAESAIFKIHFYQERKLWKKKSLALEWIQTGV